MANLLINLAVLTAKPTGISVYARNLFPYLRDLQPTLLIAQEEPDYPCHPVPATMTPAQGTKGHLARLLWTQFQLPRLYRQLEGGLLFSPLPEAPIGTRCRYVVTVHDLIPLRFPRWRSPLTNYFRFWVPHVLAGAAHILCDSESTASDVIQFYRIPAQRVTPVLLAHDAQHFRLLNLPTRNYFLYVGRHDPYKNLDRMITAFAALPASSDCELWIAGPPDRRYTPLLEAQVAELGLTQRVKFLSYVPYSDLPILLNQALALVFPSRWEGFGLPVLEAMACGTPVITTPVSSIPEVAGDAALMVEPLDTGAIAAAMGAIVADPQLRADLSQRSLTQAQRFSWAWTGATTAQILGQYL